MANMPEKNVKEACRLNQIDTCLDSWHRISWIGQSESSLAVSGAVLFYSILFYCVFPKTFDTSADG